MGLFTKIVAMLAGSPLIAGIGKAIGHFSVGDTKSGITDLFTIVEQESGSHPLVVAQLIKLQNALAAQGLANPVPATATTVIPSTTSSTTP